MKVAVVHDWLITYAGAERVLEAILSIYPEAHLYSLVDFLPADNRDFILNKHVETSFIQKLPYAEKHFRNYFFLMPVAIEQFDLSRYDIIISSSHAVAKGVLTNVHQVHFCYFNNIMSYAWDFYQHYMKEYKLNKGLKGIVARFLLHHVRNWDALTTRRSDYLIANSKYMAKKIKKIYGRNLDVQVIYPPVDVTDFTCETNKDDFYLTVSRLVPFKRVDVIVRAFSKMPQKRLVVIGDGPGFKKLKSAAGANIEFLGYQKTDVVKEYMQKARAIISASEEPFGISSVEAQACGTPVIAFIRGGMAETVIYGKTGVFFHEQTPEHLINAVKDFEDHRDDFDPHEIRKNAARFSRERFEVEFREYMQEKLDEFYVKETQIFNVK